MTMPNRLEENIQAMARRFPSFNVSTTTAGGVTVGRWTGTVQPIKTTSGLFELLDDLENDRDVYIVGDEIRHLPGCGHTHCRHSWMDKLKDLNATFQLEIVYRGNETFPRCSVVSPAIPREKGMHMWADGSICAFLPAKDVWNWSRDTVADLMPDWLVWLVKWMVYNQSGVWIGAQHQFSPYYHLQILKSKDLCWCGSGQQYRHCHKKEEEVAAGMVPPPWLRHRLRRR
jgi:hypothetical protein